MEVAKHICGKTLICPEVGKDGMRCKCVYIMEELDIEREMFLSISYDRTQQVPMFTYCPIGGMPFEDIEKLHGSKIKKIFF